jgi:Rrf2 family transcriptional regulator, nitric oxide-sensitive transcriptional repressor
LKYLNIRLEILSAFVNISEAATIAIHSLALIARSRNGINARKLAEVTKFSKNHLAKILHILVRHNFLDSVRGPSGGFTLKKDPADVSLLDVYQVIEGELTQFECAVSCKNCYFDVCIFGHYPHRFTGDFRNYLMEKKLNDFNINIEV